MVAQCVFNDRTGERCRSRARVHVHGLLVCHRHIEPLSKLFAYLATHEPNSPTYENAVEAVEEARIRMAEEVLKRELSTKMLAWGAGDER